MKGLKRKDRPKAVSRSLINKSRLYQAQCADPRRSWYPASMARFYLCSPSPACEVKKTIAVKEHGRRCFDDTISA